MNQLNIFISSVYDHFFQMTLKGRKVNSLTYTPFIIALELSILSIAIINIIMFSFGYSLLSLSKLLFFGLVGLIYFGWTVLVEKLYFDNEKIFKLHRTYLAFPQQKRNTFKIISLAFLILTPIVAIFVLSL